MSVRPYFGNRAIVVKDQGGQVTAGPALREEVAARLTSDQQRLFQDARQVLYRAPKHIMFVLSTETISQELNRK